MARKRVFKERTDKEAAIDNAVAEAREARDVNNTKPKLQGTRAWISPSDYNRLKLAATALGVDIAVLLGDVIRDYLAGGT